LAINGLCDILQLIDAAGNVVLLYVAHSVRALPVALDFDPVVAFLPEVVAELGAKLWRMGQHHPGARSLDEIHGPSKRLIRESEDHEVEMGWHDLPGEARNTPPIQDLGDRL
jgi:hypothetical protein